MAALKVSEFGNTKVYNCTAGKTDPQWQDDFDSKKITSLRYNQEYRRRIEFIQDFNFPTASSRVKISKEGKHIGATGMPAILTHFILVHHTHTLFRLII